MKVIFLDFDGVLNSEGSFVYEDRRRNEWKLQGIKGPVNETLCNVCTSNFQMILDKFPEVKVVISSTWREMFSLDWLKDKLAEYRIDSSRVIDVTPIDHRKGDRGKEIQDWLDKHPEVTHYIIIDDNDWGIRNIHGFYRFIQTSWETGMTVSHVEEAMEKLKTPKKDKTRV